MGNYEGLDNQLNKYLRLATFPIGVKLLENSEDLNAVKYLKKPGHKIALCQIFSYARYYGWTMGCTKEDNLCPLAEISVGFEKSNKLFEEGAFFIGRYNETKEAAKKTSSTMPQLTYGQYSAIVSGALNRIDFKPDLILSQYHAYHYASVVAGYVSKILKIPHVIRSHDIFFITEDSSLPRRIFNSLIYPRIFRSILNCNTFYSVSTEIIRYLSSFKKYIELFFSDLSLDKLYIPNFLLKEL